MKTKNQKRIKIQPKVANITNSCGKRKGSCSYLITLPYAKAA